MTTNFNLSSLFWHDFIIWVFSLSLKGLLNHGDECDTRSVGCAKSPVNIDLAEKPSPQ